MSAYLTIAVLAAAIAMVGDVAFLVKQKRLTFGNLLACCLTSILFAFLWPIVVPLYVLYLVLKFFRFTCL